MGRGRHRCRQREDELRVGPLRVAIDTIRYGAPWMNGSADCEFSSSIATDEEPPGPLDLSSSILTTDLAYDAQRVSVDTTLALATGSWHGSTGPALSASD